MSTRVDFCCSEALDLTPINQALVFKGMAALGAKHVRIGVPWSVVNPQRGQYDWQRMDWAITAATEAGLVPDLTVVFPKPKFGFWFMATDATSADFAAFCTAWVNHCKPLGVKSYELWNEPNDAGSWGVGGWLWIPARVDVTSFMTYFLAGSQAVKKADPTATVVFAGIMASADSPFGVCRDSVGWLQDCYKLGLKNNYDVLAYHPYSTQIGGQFLPLDPLTNGTPSLFVSYINALRLVQVAQSDLKPMWCNEFGFSTAEQSATVARDRLQAQIAYLRGVSYVERIYLFSYRDMVLSNATYSSTNKNMNYGLVDYTLKPKPVLYDWAKNINASAS